MRGIVQLQFLLLLFGEAGEHAVEHVVIPLVRALRDDTGFLQQILLDFRPLNDTLVVEVYVNVLAEARRIVVSHSLSIAKS